MSKESLSLLQWGRGLNLKFNCSYLIFNGSFDVNLFRDNYIGCSRKNDSGKALP
jgi:hypothetical protein